MAELDKREIAEVQAGDYEPPEGDELEILEPQTIRVKGAAHSVRCAIFSNDEAYEAASCDCGVLIARLKEQHPFDENEDDSHRLSGFRGYMS
jgi:hypothetical protein